MQIQASGQSQSTSQMQQTQTQVRKMDGSGNGQGLQDGSNRTVPQTAAVQSSAPLNDNSTFSTFV